MRGHPQAVLPARHQRPDHPVPRGGGGGPGDRLHAGRTSIRRPAPPSAGASRPGRARLDGVPHGLSACVQLRADPSRHAARGRRRVLRHTRSVARSQHDAAARAGGERCDLDLRAQGGSFIGVRARAGQRPRVRGSAGRRSSHRARVQDRAVLAAVAGTVHLSGPLARDRAPVGARAQADDVRANGCDRGRSHLQPARGNRWRTQLGLSLHLDPRCSVHALCADADRFHRSRRPVHALDRESVSRAQPRQSPADHVRHRRPPRPHRGDSRSPRRVHELAAPCGSATARTSSSSSISMAS